VPVVARQLGRHLVVGCAPAEVPAPVERRREEQRQIGGDGGDLAPILAAQAGRLHRGSPDNALAASIAFCSSPAIP